MYLFLLIFFTVCLITTAIASNSLAPWMPTRKRDLERIFKLAKLKPGETFYELGCGNGRVVIYASEHHNIKAVGIEMAFFLYLVCKIRQVFIGNKNLTFKCKSLFREDLSPADVIYVFGMEGSLKKRLRKKLEKELKPGARVISYSFPIAPWQPVIKDKPSEKDLAIYLYKI